MQGFLAWCEWKLLRGWECHTHLTIRLPPSSLHSWRAFTAERGVESEGVCRETKVADSTRRWPCTGPPLGQRRRRWPNGGPGQGRVGWDGSAGLGQYTRCSPLHRDNTAIFVFSIYPFHRRNSELPRSEIINYFKKGSQINQSVPKFDTVVSNVRISLVSGLNAPWLNVRNVQGFHSILFTPTVTRHDTEGQTYPSPGLDTLSATSQTRTIYSMWVK